MKSECGICEFRGDVASAPLFICFNCADAIRRLVWIRERERQAAEAPLAAPRIGKITMEKTAATHEP